MAKLRGFITLALLVALSGTGNARATQGGADDDFDRFDGMGETGKRVDVIEWAGNLEIHVYPRGSLKGLALKIDRTNKDKPVLVIGYRFDVSPKKQYIRRAILGIDLPDTFNVFKDPTETEFDKIVISRHDLAGNLARFKLDPEPKSLYPEDHPGPQVAGTKAKGAPARSPASAAENPSSPEGTTGPYYLLKGPEVDEDSGTVRPFKW